MATLSEFVSARYPGVFDISVPYIKKTEYEDSESYVTCEGEYVTTSDNAVLHSWPKNLDKVKSIDFSNEMYAKLILPSNVSDRCRVKYDESSPFEAGRKALKLGRSYDPEINHLDSDNCLANNLLSFDAKKAVLIDNKYTVLSLDPEEYGTMQDSEREYYDDADKAQMEKFMKVMYKVYNTVKLLHDNNLYINNLSEQFIYMSEINDDVIITNLTELSRIPQLMLDEVCLLALYCSQKGDFSLLDEMYEISPVIENKDLQNFPILPPASAGILGAENQDGGGGQYVSMFAMLSVTVVMSVIGSV